MWIYPDLPIENVDLLDCENRCFHHGVIQWFKKPKRELTKKNMDCGIWKNASWLDKNQDLEDPQMLAI